MLGRRDMVTFLHVDNRTQADSFGHVAYRYSIGQSTGYCINTGRSIVRDWVARMFGAQKE